MDYFNLIQAYGGAAPGLAAQAEDRCKQWTVLMTTANALAQKSYDLDDALGRGLPCVEGPVTPEADRLWTEHAAAKEEAERYFLLAKQEEKAIGQLAERILVAAERAGMDVDL